MTREETFDAWAPPASIWSPWTKPVLFAHVGGVMATPSQLPQVNTDFAPSADGRTALVLDLPAAGGVIVGIELASEGYRPVPLYNACPSPHSGSDISLSVCDVAPIVDALEAGAPVLQNLLLPPNAPPAFLLDVNRRVGTGVQAVPGMFDNRSVSLPTDFPSANFLLAQGVQRIVLIQQDSLEPQVDLSHTLLRWQQAGISIDALSIVDPMNVQPIHVSKPFMFKMFWQRLLATAGLRRSPLGGFGGVLPIPSSGG